jgi:hypothetical protein
MKHCPSCNRTFDDTQSFCSVDATPLISDASAYDPAKTVLATGPDAMDNAQPAQTPNADATPGYQQPYQQPYPQQQWMPPQQQWGAPPASRNPNKMILLAVIGLVLAVGVGLGIYFLTRSGSTSGSSSSNGSSTSTASKRFVGTWAEEDRPNSKGARFTEDGKIMDFSPRGEEQVGTYTANGDKASINIKDKALTGTLESDSRMRIEGGPRTVYLVKK